MADRPRLEVAPRSAEQTGSRASRRLRREGRVPGVVYAGGEPARPFTVGSRELRTMLAGGEALFDLAIEGADPVPVVLKEAQHDPVRGHTLHVDLQQVNLRQSIQTTVGLALEGVEEAPGVVEGGILEQVLHELSIEALPTEIPEQITLDVSQMTMGDTLSVADIRPPSGVEILDEPEATAATVQAPRVEEEPEPDVEEEAELVGEAEAEPGEGTEGEGAEPGGEADEGSE